MSFARQNILLRVFLNCIFLCFFNSFTFAKKPKIVVFTSKGGNGHMSACNALAEALPECEFKLVRPIHDFFKSFFDEEEWYGEFLKSGWIGTGNFIVRYPAPVFFDVNIKSFKKRFLRFLKQEKPDLLISVIPFLNYPAAWAADQCGIPFMLITLDADLTNWLLKLKKCHNHNFVITVQAKTPRIKKQLKRRHIPMSCVREVGSPLRKDFFVPKDKQAIKKEWNVPDGKKVIMLMRGGTGSSKLVDYVDRLIKLDIPAHLLVCIGRNTNLISKLNRIKTSDNVSFSIIPFTPKIPDLMAISDLLITQPSPNTCNEAMYMKLPILVDMSSNCLFWERATIDWLKLCGSGQVFKRMSQLNKLVVQILEKNSKKVKNIQNQCMELSFNKEIRNIVMSELLVRSTVSK